MMNDAKVLDDLDDDVINAINIMEARNMKERLRLAELENDRKWSYQIPLGGLKYDG